jgi:membrane protease subunit HflC
MAEQKKRNMASIVLAIIVMLVFVLYMIAFTVPFTETVVVTRFGKVINTYSGANPDEVGLKWKLPWPIDKVTSFDNRKRTYESKMEQLFTKDEQSITVTTYTTWQIGSTKDDVIRYLKEINTPQKAGLVLTSMVHDAMSKVVGKYNFENFVSTDPEKMKFDQIEKDIREIIVGQASESYGIEVVIVGIKRLELPEESTKKVFDRMRQEREQLAKKYRAEGESRARQIRAQANRQASDIENRARAEAIMIRGKGDVEAAKYYKIFADNPSLHNFIKRLETLKEILPQRSTLILDADQVPPFDLLSSKMLKWLNEQGQAPTSSQPSAVIKSSTE